MCVHNGSVSGKTCFYLENNIIEGEENTKKCVEQKQACSDWEEEYYCTYNNSISVPDTSCEFSNSECRVVVTKEPSKSVQSGTVVSIVLVVIFGSVILVLMVIILIYIFKIRNKSKEVENKEEIEMKKIEEDDVEKQKVGEEDVEEQKAEDENLDDEIEKGRTNENDDIGEKEGIYGEREEDNFTDQEREEEEAALEEAEGISGNEEGDEENNNF
jgi:flagellar biosynthesis/type III secretory pathway M-ring protein FliF/YscJ